MQSSPFDVLSDWTCTKEVTLFLYMYTLQFIRMCYMYVCN